MKIDFRLADWTETARSGGLRSVFRKPQNWLYHAPQSTAQWYTVVLSNLERRDFDAERASAITVRELLKAGLSRDAFERFRAFAALTSEELCRAMDLPQRTLARRERFQSEESERLLRVASAFQRALDLFEDLDLARTWFVTPRSAFGDKAPLEFCDTGPGAEAVEQLLGRLEHGVFS